MTTEQPVSTDWGFPANYQRFQDDKLNELYSSGKGKKLVDAKKRTSGIIMIVLAVLIFWQGIMVFH